MTMRRKVAARALFSALRPQGVLVPHGDAGLLDASAQTFSLPNGSGIRTTTSTVSTFSELGSTSLRESVTEHSLQDEDTGSVENNMLSSMWCSAPPMPTPEFLPTQSSTHFTDWTNMGLEHALLKAVAGSGYVNKKA